MSTWEERMALQARAKGWDQRQILGRERAAELAAFVDEHEGHHGHLHGSMHECSCGHQFGVICVAFPVFESEEEAAAYWDALACGVCGKKGVWGPG